MIPHARLLNVVCRTVHLAAFGLVLGGHAWGIEADRLLPPLWITIGSGVALMALELLASAHWLLEGRGLMVLLKLGLLLLVPLAWEHRLPILLAVVAVASVGSHMPARFRHASLLSVGLAVTARLGGAPAPGVGCGQLASTGLFGKGERP
ncbi:MAG: hypothetical protein HY726_22000 [Candidatus Rokubacteria bacterium]|nr:hypothetical protein [Candidatus Rokubacteria bacterium]